MRWPPTFWTTLGYRSVKGVAAIHNKTMIVIPTTNSQTPSAESALTPRVMVYVDAKAGDHHEGDVRGEENHKIEKYAKVHCARNLAVENPSGGTQLG